MNRRQVYEEKMAAQLKEWDAQLTLLLAKAQRAEADAKLKYLDLAETMRRKLGLAQHRLRELQAASDEAWESAKSGVENIWAELRAAVADTDEKSR